MPKVNFSDKYHYLLSVSKIYLTGIGVAPSFGRKLCILLCALVLEFEGTLGKIRGVKEGTGDS